MTPAGTRGYEHGIRYHAPRRREPGPVVGVAASLLIMLVAGQLAFASPERDDATAGALPPVAGTSTSSAPSTPSTSSRSSTPSRSSAPSAPSAPSRSSRSSTPSVPTSGPSAPQGDGTGEPGTAVAGAVVVELRFDSGADTPAPGAAEVLDEVADEALGDPTVTVKVVGHAEASNDRDLEKQLSLERALRVVDLLARRGVPAERVQVVAAGATQASDEDADNRRVTVEVAPG